MSEFKKKLESPIDIYKKYGMIKSVKKLFN